ncbi:MAG: LptF/LptG family permease [Rickettsiales bacterium]|jgi:lipopolysaccharide export LptBFGC system permease protein LptF|nr:LptF/LptG family permease [Rickettsiales bacterium]
MKITTKFLARRFANSLLLSLAVICGIIFATSFMQEIAGSTVAEALDSSFSHFLELFPMFLPLAVFIGTLLAFYRLLLSSELTIVQSAGLSPFKIMRPMLAVSALLGMVTAMVINPLSTRYNAKELRANKIERIDSAVFVRERTAGGSIIIRAQNMETDGADGLRFANATLVRQNDAHRITGRTDAPVMVLKNGIISAESALTLDSKGREKKSGFSERTSLEPRSIIRQYLKPNQVSFWELPRLIGALGKMDIPTGAHVIQFLSLLFLPVSLISMTVLGVMFSQTRERRGFSFAKHFGFGIITCFIVYFMVQIFNAIGISGAMHPLLAIFFPPAIVLFFAGAMITKTDNI